MINVGTLGWPNRRGHILRNLVESFDEICGHLSKWENAHHEKADASP
jgi:hypothetical protein